MANYSLKITPEHERVEHISNASSSSSDAEKFHFFQSKEIKLPVIRVPIDLPLYRLENYRTRDTQLSLVAHKRYPSGFFDKSRHEDIDVQRAQHEILIDFAKRGKGEDVTAIWNELEKRANQTESLLIAANGIVVNGNRRLCAMRELFASGDPRYSSYSHVNCIVLPSSATEDEILEVEIRLQMAPETKLRYSWITVALACRDLRDHGHAKSQIADWMRIDEARIDREVSKLDYAELYLTEWLAEPGDYSRLDGTEQAFTQMAVRNNSKSKSAEHREIAQKLDFFLIENRSDIEDRAYTFINTIESNTPRFLEEFADAAGIELNDKSAPSGQLEIDIGAPTAGEKDFTPVVEALQAARTDKEQTRELISQIASVCELLSEQKKAKNKAALKFARDALRKLGSVDLATADPTSIGELTDVLWQIEERARNLITKIETL